MQSGREGTKDSPYQQELGATAACTKRIMEETKGIVREGIGGKAKCKEEEATLDSGKG